MADTIKASGITDHAFVPAYWPLHVLAAGRWDRTPEEIKRDMTSYSANPYLCQHCRMAEAAHRETTVKR